MALSKRAATDDDDFWVVYAAHRAALQEASLQRAVLLAQLHEANEVIKRTHRRRQQILLAAVRLCSRERNVWAYPRESSWYDATLPHLPDSCFRENFRVDRRTFSYIVGVCECMRRRDTNMRRAIPLEKRVAIGLYRLATSAEERTVAHVFGVSRSSVNVIFREFCNVVVSQLEPQHMGMPRAHELVEHMQRFAASTGFPQGVGALDGCHIEVCPPKKHASDYYNYKGWYSVILLAVVDHAYKFLYTNVGSPGRNHDAAVFDGSRLPSVLDSSLFKIGTKTIEGVEVGPVLLADQAFPLQCNLMKPYPQPGRPGSPSEAFNYRLSSARRVVENGFGRMKARFRMVHKGLECDIDNVNIIVRTACVLHNICEDMSDHCDSSWLEAARADDERRPQPVRTSNREEPSGVAVRNALAKHLAAAH